MTDRQPYDSGNRPIQQPTKGMGAPPPASAYRPRTYHQETVFWPYPHSRGKYGPGPPLSRDKFADYHTQYFAPQGAYSRHKFDPIGLGADPHFFTREHYCRYPYHYGPYLDEFVVIEGPPRRSWLRRNAWWMITGFTIGWLWSDFRRWKAQKRVWLEARRAERDMYLDELRNSREDDFWFVDDWEDYHQDDDGSVFMIHELHHSISRV